jgi:flagellar biosynthesis protein FlhG
MDLKEHTVDQAETLRQLIAEKPGSDDGAAKARSPLRVIAVTSGKGGVGKTNVSTNLAVLAARMGKRVLIIDADLGLANVEIVLGLKPRYHMGDLLDSSLSIDEVLVEGPHGIRILSAGSGVQGLSRLDEAQKLRLVSALDPIEDRFDLVIVDSGAGIGDNVLFFVGAAQEALLVVSPEPTSLVDAYAVVKVLSQQAGVRHFNVIVNPVVDELPARDIFYKLTAVTNRFLSANVRHLGYIPRDENLHRAIMAQRPVVDIFPRSPASRALGLIAEKLFNEPQPQFLDGGLKLMWQRLFREAQAQPEPRAVAAR